MSLKEILLNVVAICSIVLLPHLGFLPNFLYSIPILIIVWLALKQSNQKFNDLGISLKKFKIKSILIGCIVAVSTLAFMQLAFFPILGYFVTFGETDIELYDFLRENKAQFYFTLIMGFLIGGLYEEIVFHGFMFTRIEKIFNGKYSTHISFIITAYLFGLYHIQLGMDGLINAFVVGAVYLALFLYFKRNLWYSVFCHGIYNTIVITMIYHGYL